MADQELRLKAKAEGFEDAAKKIGAVDAAQKKVTSGVKTATKGTTAAKEAQDKFNASTEDYTSLLGRIHPALGAMADAGVKGTKVLNDLAKQQLNVRDMANKAAMALRGMAGTLKLFAAAALPILGLTLLWKAISRIREQAERAAKALERMLAAQREPAKRAAEEAKRTAEEEAKARRRRPLTAEEEESIEQTMGAVPADLSTDDRARLRRITGSLGGAKGFGPGAGQFTGRELEELARQGFEPEPEATRKEEQDRARIFQKARAGNVEADQERRRVRRESERRKAAEQARAAAQGKATITGDKEFQALIDRMAAEQGVDPAELRKVVIEELQGRMNPPSALNPFRVRAQYPEYGGISRTPAARSWVDLVNPFGPGAQLLETPLQVGFAETMRVLAEFLGQGGGAPGEPVSTNIHMNGRYVFPDPFTQRRNTVNGETTARQAERVP